MTRGISDAPLVKQEQDAEISNEEIMQFLDEVAMMVRDLDTRLSTLERNLLAPAQLNSDSKSTPKKKFLNGK